MQAYRWPGNVRELRNVVEVAVTMGEAPPVGPSPQATGDDADEALLSLPYKEARAAVLGGFEQRYLERLMGQCDGNVTKAAQVAEIDRSYLFGLLKRHGLR